MHVSLFIRALTALPGVLATSHCQATQAVSERLYFLNNPEYVCRKTVLEDAYLPSGEHARLFFHHFNGTGHIQKYRLSFAHPVDTVHLGIAISRDPGRAGAIAARRFLESTEQASINIVERTIEPGQTVSGIMDFITNCETRFVCRMGKNATERRGQSITLPYRVEKTNVPLDFLQNVYSVRLGERNREVRGEYGVTFRMKISASAKKSSRLRIKVSPRGGEMRFVYRLNGQTHMTRLISAWHTCRLKSLRLRPGEQIIFEHIPTGGCNLPVAIQFRLISA